MAKHTVLLTAGMAVLALMLTVCVPDGGGNGDGDIVMSNRCITYQELMELMKKGAVELTRVVVRQECP